MVPTKSRSSLGSSSRILKDFVKNVLEDLTLRNVNLEEEQTVIYKKKW